MIFEGGGGGGGCQWYMYFKKCIAWSAELCVCTVINNALSHGQKGLIGSVT